ncbi:MAG TPA: ankyrin repeat domain-containing protein [Anaerolineales bacterium]|nr:ankyrin repeat domain-containing protein [Anaerolineales bacterium]
MDTEQTFLEAVKAGDRDKVAELLAQDASLANSRVENGLSAILLAAYYGHNELAQEIAAQASRTNIFEAAAVGDLLRVAELVEADPDQANAFALDGFQPLGLASFFGHLPVVEYLLIKGAEVNSASNNEQKVLPLHSAVASQNLPIARALLEQGAGVNARQQGDFTPLHGAAQNGQVEMVELLLDYGAEVEALSEAGNSALDMAVGAGHEEAAKMLRRAQKRSA